MTKYDLGNIMTMIGDQDDDQDTNQTGNSDLNCPFVYTCQKRGSRMCLSSASLPKIMFILPLHTSLSIHLLLLLLYLAMECNPRRQNSDEDGDGDKIRRR